MLGLFQTFQRAVSAFDRMVATRKIVGIAESSGDDVMGSGTIDMVVNPHKV